jgi:rubrerythrin
MTNREAEVLAKYKEMPRKLSKEFVDAIPWSDVKNYEIDEKFIPVLVYMRDVEAFTDIYYKDMIRTPTGRDPVIRQFMDQWQVEELQHANLLDRFLNEAGYPTSKKWLDEARAKIPASFKIKGFIQPWIANLIGERFSAVHMTFGAIQELTTLQGYKRMWETAKHPVLEHILRGIASEESIHIFFYRNIAKLKLEESQYSQRIARFLVEKFWSPVGQGTKPKEETDYLIKTLFGDEEGFQRMDVNVNGSLRLLPGFETTRRVSDRVAEVIRGEQEGNVATS